VLPLLLYKVLLSVILLESVFCFVTTKYWPKIVLSLTHFGSINRVVLDSDKFLKIWAYYDFLLGYMENTTFIKVLLKSKLKALSYGLHYPLYPIIQFIMTFQNLCWNVRHYVRVPCLELQSLLKWKPWFEKKLFNWFELIGTSVIWVFS